MAAEQQALFAGGCFWCTEAAMDDIQGVKQTVSGYTGGTENTATYEQVSSGQSGHFEALLVEYDDAIVDYKTLLDVFWQSIDPLDAGGQFADRGPQYQTAIFYLSDEQKQLAEKSKAALEQKLGATVVTKILPAENFFPAESYHQDYHRKNPLRYKLYKEGSGRNKRLKELYND